MGVCGLETTSQHTYLKKATADSYTLQCMTIYGHHNQQLDLINWNGAAWYNKKNLESLKQGLLGPTQTFLLIWFCWALKWTFLTLFTDVSRYRHYVQDLKKSRAGKDPMCIPVIKCEC